MPVKRARPLDGIFLNCLNFLDFDLNFPFYVGFSVTYFRFFLTNFLIVGDDMYQSKNPLNTVINPNNENARRIMVLKLSLP